MADLLVNPLGTTTDVTVPANSAISVWSLGAFDVFTLTAGVNQPPVSTLLASRAAGSDQFTSSVFSASVSTTVRIQASGQLQVWYSVGTNPVVRSGGRQQVHYQLINPSNFSAINATATATTAQILSGYITSSTAAAVVVTNITAAALDAATTLAVGDSFDVVMINTGGTNALSLSGGTGMTYLGVVSTTAGGMTARFIKTAAGAFTIYRI
jgi:hypothetical protein